jgi:predicted O-methyltransferase YrrM
MSTLVVWLLAALIVLLTGALVVVRRRAADAGAQLARLAATVDGLRREMAADGDVSRTVLNEVRQSLGLRIDALADWAAAGAAAERRALLAREFEERDHFVETLAEGHIRPLQLAQVFPGIEAQAVEIGVIDPETRHPNHVDMLYVCAMARHLRARRVFEFGTYLGRTTYHLALGQHVEQVITLDLSPAGAYPADLKIGRAVRAVHERGLQGHFYRGTDAAGRIVQLHGDSRTFDYGPYAGRMDFVFVDGGHTYDLVANDTERALALIRPGGVIVWHDFAPKGRDVARLARQLARTRALFWIGDTSLLVYIDGVDAMAHPAATPVYARSVIKPV